MASIDLDKIHKKRIGIVSKKMDDTNFYDENDIFVSERVIDSLHDEKSLVESFSQPRIMALLPFTPIVYVEICPNCINKENFESFKALTISGMVIPIITGEYCRYPEAVQDFLCGHDHISCYEYGLYRSVILNNLADGGICSHCVDKRVSKIKLKVKGKRNAPAFRNNLKRLLYNIHPFVNPDYELLDAIDLAFRNLDIETTIQLRDMSEAIHSFRTSQAFNASLSINETDLSNVPSGITNENDEARQFGLDLRRMVSDGLGLKIPTDINIEQYIELVNDFRPQIIGITNEILSSSTKEKEQLVGDLLGSISAINMEIERIKGLKRYLLYEAGIELVGKNKAFVASLFVASAMGLAGSITGCAIAAGGIVADAAKRSGKIRTGKTMSRLGTKIHHDLQPDIDKLISKYVGTNVPAMHILSIRKAVEESK